MRANQAALHPVHGKVAHECATTARTLYSGPRRPHESRGNSKLPGPRGRSSMVELQPSKLAMRVRFSSPARLEASRVLSHRLASPFPLEDDPQTPADLEANRVLPHRPASPFSLEDDPQTPADLEANRVLPHRPASPFPLGDDPQTPADLEANRVLPHRPAPPLPRRGPPPDPRGSRPPPRTGLRRHRLQPPLVSVAPCESGHSAEGCSMTSPTPRPPVRGDRRGGPAHPEPWNSRYQPVR